MSLSIGIDSGSTATKGILFDNRDGGRIVRRYLVPTPFVRWLPSSKAGRSSRPICQSAPT